MQDQTTMTMSVPDGDGGVIETGPLTAEDLKAATNVVQKRLFRICLLLQRLGRLYIKVRELPGGRSPPVWFPC